MEYQSTGYYSVNAKPPQPAEFILKRNKLQIIIRDFDGSQKTINWYYDNILKEKSQAKTFKHKEFPPQYIQLHSGLMEEELENKIDRHGRLFISRKGTILYKVFGFFLLLILATYFLVLPWLAGVIAEQFPKDYEESLGQGVFDSMKQDFIIDEQKTALINDFFDELKIPSEYDIRITVVKSDVTNAFALPGGNIVVYDTIMAQMSSYEELAALLSHEFIHVENKHSLKSMMRQLGATIFLSLVVGDITAIGAVILANADNLKGLSYSRSLEKEADDEGLKLLAERKIDCGGFVRLFQILKKETKVETSEWTSSHPDLNKRIKNIESKEICGQYTPVTDSTLHHLFVKLKS